MKNEWDRVKPFIDFYRQVHKVERFIIYDNQSDGRPPNIILDDPGVIIVDWDIPYQLSLSKPIASPPLEWTIAAQNSAYSNCLKKYHDSEWTLLVDLDEFVIDASNQSNLDNLTKKLPESVDTLVFSGYWAGCNSLKPEEISANLDKVILRSKENCANKLMLRTREHFFTRSIHWPYPSLRNFTTIYPDASNSFYFFHLWTASTKHRECECWKYCSVLDLALSVEIDRAKNMTLKS